jgi:hypothetical protein
VGAEPALRFLPRRSTPASHGHTADPAPCRDSPTSAAGRAAYASARSPPASYGHTADPAVRPREPASACARPCRDSSAPQ